MRRFINWCIDHAVLYNICFYSLLIVCAVFVFRLSKEAPLVEVTCCIGGGFVLQLFNSSVQIYERKSYSKLKSELEISTNCNQAIKDNKIKHHIRSRINDFVKQQNFTQTDGEEDRITLYTLKPSKGQSSIQLTILHRYSDCPKYRNPNHEVYELKGILKKAYFNGYYILNKEIPEYFDDNKRPYVGAIRKEFSDLNETDVKEKAMKSRFQVAFCIKGSDERECGIIFVESMKPMRFKSKDIKVAMNRLAESISFIVPLVDHEFTIPIKQDDPMLTPSKANSMELR